MQTENLAPAESRMVGGYGRKVPANLQVAMASID